MEDTRLAQFTFTKLLVNDLEKSAAFFRSVCGLVEQQRVDSAIAGRIIHEIVLGAADASGVPLVLVKFLDGVRPANDGVILGFVTDDLEAFLARTVTAGGAVHDAGRSATEHGYKVAFVTDVEGHLIEVVEPMR